MNRQQRRQAARMAEREAKAPATRLPDVPDPWDFSTDPQAGRWMLDHGLGQLVRFVQQDVRRKGEETGEYPDIVEAVRSLLRSHDAPAWVIGGVRPSMRWAILEGRAVER